MICVGPGPQLQGIFCTPTTRHSFDKVRGNRDIYNDKYISRALCASLPMAICPGQLCYWERSQGKEDNWIFISLFYFWGGGVEGGGEWVGELEG